MEGYILMQGKLINCSNIEELAKSAVDNFIAIAADSIQNNGIFNVVLSGGSTPKTFLNLLATKKNKLEWEKIHFFWGDERCVGPDDDQSNFRMANEALLSKIDIPAKNIHRIKGELEHDAAWAYEKEIKSHFNTHNLKTINFHLIILGMGEDGHTASLFPNDNAINETKKIVFPVYVAKLNSHRITLTPIIIKSANNIIVLISGDKKKEVLKQVLYNKINPLKLPIQLVMETKGNLMWIVDFYL